MNPQDQSAVDNTLHAVAVMTAWTSTEAGHWQPLRDMLTIGTVQERDDLLLGFVNLTSALLVQRRDDTGAAPIDTLQHIARLIANAEIKPQDDQ